MATEEIKFLKEQIKNSLESAKMTVAACKRRELGLTDNERGRFEGRVTTYEHILLEISYLNDNMPKKEASK